MRGKMPHRKKEDCGRKLKTRSLEDAWMDGDATLLDDGHKTDNVKR
jgi:hypothetical protein